ncbi:MAG: hypothetical protein MJH10_20210 [Epibacterium sp.]|nr:hypothetical protein [Epibacterium sp.]NQX75797.1 hypothetical protein [Epibacterium sp.]
MENEEHWTWRTLRWFRDEAGAFFASFWMILALYGVGGWLLWVWFKVDAEFSRPLAGGVIPSDVTQHFSWAILAFSVIVGMAAVWCNDRAMRVLKTCWTVLGSIAAVILLFHAYGLAAKVMEKQFDAAAAITDVAEVNTDAIDDQIADLVFERDTLQANTQVDLDRFQRSIDSITNDGLDNDDEAQEFADKQEAAIQARDARTEEIRQEIATLRTEKRGVSAAATQDEADSSSFNELFTLMARFYTREWDPAKTPSNTSQYASGIIFFFILFGFGKLLMMTLFTFAFQMQLRAADMARKSRAAKKGHETRKAKEAEASQPLQIQDEGWWKERIVKALDTHYKKHTLKGICESYFRGVAPGELREHLLRQMERRLELPKADPIKNTRAIERGFLSSQRTTYLLQEHIDFFHSEGAYAPQSNLNGVSDANGQNPVNNLPA